MLQHGGAESQEGEIDIRGLGGARYKNLLATGGAAWTGTLDSAFSKAIADVLPSNAQSAESEPRFDLVIITQEESGTHIAFHGVLISRPTTRLSLHDQ